MEKHQVTDSEIWAYISKTADADTSQKVEAWRASDTFDLDRFDEIAEVFHLTGIPQVTDVEINRAKAKFFEVVDSTDAVSTADSLNATEAQRPFWRGFLKYAAAVALMITSSYFIYQNLNQVTEQTTYGEQREIDLPDGSKVWLNASSSLTYSKNFPREMYLEGEAFFDVIRNEKVPFTVQTHEDLKITVLGTTYNVKSYEEMGYTETTLYTGKVKIGSDGLTTREVILRPYDRAVYFGKKDSLARSEVSTQNSIPKWREGELRFEDMTLSDIAQDLNLRYNAGIAIENDAVGHFRFTASFDTGTPTAEILETLSLSKSFSYERTDDGDWLIR